MLRPDFTYDDLNIPQMLAVTRRQSIMSAAFAAIDIRTLLHRFSQSAPAIQNAIKSSHLSDQAQALYLDKF